jgi:hypothetical protein
MKTMSGNKSKRDIKTKNCEKRFFFLLKINVEYKKKTIENGSLFSLLLF